MSIHSLKFEIEPNVFSYISELLLFIQRGVYMENGYINMRLLCYGWIMGGSGKNSRQAMLLLR